MLASLTSIDATLVSTFFHQSVSAYELWQQGGLTVDIAESSVGLGAVLLAPKSRFIVAGSLAEPLRKADGRPKAGRWRRTRPDISSAPQEAIQVGRRR